MCGRFTLRTNPHLLAEIFRVRDAPDVKPRYNISPTQSILTVKASDGGRAFDLMKWGLIPSWAKEAKIGNSMINARAESVRTKPGFRSAFKSRRCLVVADGFYEWKPDVKAKQPYLMRRRMASRSRSRECGKRGKTSDPARLSRWKQTRS